MRTVTYDEVKQVAHELVQENPNGRNGEDVCEYVDSDGKPSCVVGHILYRLNIPYPEGNPALMDYDARELSELLGVEVTRDAFAFLDILQSKADEHVPATNQSIKAGTKRSRNRWKESFEAACKYMGDKPPPIKLPTASDVLSGAVDAHNAYAQMWQGFIP